VRGRRPPSKDAGTKDAAPSAIEGTATYRERIAMPPGAEFEAEHQDVTRADAPAMRSPARRLELLDDAGRRTFLFEAAQPR